MKNYTKTFIWLAALFVIPILAGMTDEHSESLMAGYYLGFSIAVGAIILLHSKRV